MHEQQTQARMGNWLYSPFACVNKRAVGQGGVGHDECMPKTREHLRELRRWRWDLRRLGRFV